MKVPTRKVIAWTIAALSAGLLSEKAVDQCYCYLPTQINCWCGTWPMIASDMLCSANVWHSALQTGYGCSWSASQTTIPQKPWVRLVYEDTPYLTYTQNLYTCTYYCTHSSHPEVCPIGYVYIKGRYSCQESNAIPQGPDCHFVACP